MTFSFPYNFILFYSVVLLGYWIKVYLKFSGMPRAADSQRMKGKVWQRKLRKQETRKTYFISLKLNKIKQILHSQLFSWSLQQNSSPLSILIKYTQPSFHAHFFSLLSLTPLAHFHFQFAHFHFLFNTLWLAAFYYANPLYLMEISFFNLSLSFLRPRFQERN